MKTPTLLLFMLISASLHTQNPLEEGIHATKTVHFIDGSRRFSGLDFKMELVGKCSATYTATEMWFEPAYSETFVVKTSWNWKDIASVEIDSIKNILRFNSRLPMPSNIENCDTKQIVDYPDNNTVNIYLASKKMAREVCTWVLDKIYQCGGEAILIN